MNNSIVTGKSINVLKLLLAVNFNASVIFLLIATVISALGGTLFFEDQSELYGPLASNLRLMLVYLSLTELSVYSFCRFNNSYQNLTLLGMFLLLLAVSIEIYSAINQIPVDENYRWFFLYLGLSHIGYGGMDTMNKARSRH